MERSILIYAAIGMLVLSAVINAQTTNPNPPLVKQIAAPLPKLALIGATTTTSGRTQFFRIVLTVTNRNEIPQQLFEIPVGGKLPPNPCTGVKSRAAAVVYSERGTPMGKCIALNTRDSLHNFSFLVEKGKTVPPFVYVIVADLYTGAVYRSNMVSPFGGATK